MTNKVEQTSRMSRRQVGRPTNTHERRRQIARALIQVIAREGYSHATIAEIAREAELAPGLVHYHFKNKEEILALAFEELVLSIDARAMARLSGAKDSPRARLVAFIDAHVAMGPDADPSAVVAWVVIGAEAVTQRDVGVLYAKALTAMVDKTRELVRSCLKSEGRVTQNARAIAAGIVSLIEGAYRIGVTAPELMPRGFAAPTLRRIVLALLDQEPASA
jgi:TetR/AcrR family transcriptional regulator, transcriptional repressor of bet genes